MLIFNINIAVKTNIARIASLYLAILIYYLLIVRYEVAELCVIKRQR